MKAQMILAEAATAHPDGTVSMLRAWINHVRGSETPYPLRGALAVRIEADLGDAGQHEFDLRCLDEDGAEALPPLSGRFEVPKAGGATSFILGLQMAFQKPGRFVFILRVDRVQLQDWPIVVEKVPAPPEAPPAS